MKTFREQFGYMSWVQNESAVLRVPNDLALVKPLAMYLSEHAVVLERCHADREPLVCTALAEALHNAMVHGNLETSSELRDAGRLDEYLAVIRQRNQTPPYAARSVEIRMTVEPDSISWSITDEGPGFDTSSTPDPTHPELVQRCSGRGLLLMRAYLDDVAFNHQGNQVTLTVKPGPLDALHTTRE